MHCEKEKMHSIVHRGHLNEKGKRTCMHKQGLLCYAQFFQLFQYFEFHFTKDRCVKGMEIHNKNETELQYCAKVMLTKFAIYRALFLRYFADISEIYRLDYLRMKPIIRRYLNDISQRYRSGENSPQRYFAWFQTRFRSSEISSKRYFAERSGVRFVIFV